VCYSSPPRGPAALTLSPYTTLFRSQRGDGGDVVDAEQRHPIGRGLLVWIVRCRALGGGCGIRGRRHGEHVVAADGRDLGVDVARDRKSTRLNSSHVKISYAVFCLKK